ncbi:hypothetical protein [Streptomyces mirabilis]|uniref:hypothetical protein n=1 Tax=Streptomyces mirabilis TaxID=68239 RepID=UPI0036C5B21A
MIGGQDVQAVPQEQGRNVGDVLQRPQQPGAGTLGCSRLRALEGGLARANRWLRSVSLSCSARATASRTEAETRVVRPRSSRT